MSQFDWHLCLIVNEFLNCDFNPLNAELNPICHLLAFLGTHHILHISRIRVNFVLSKCPEYNWSKCYIIKIFINQSICLFHFPETHLQGIFATWIWKSSKSIIQVTNNIIITGTVLCTKVKCKEKYLLINKYNLYSVVKIVSIGQILVEITLFICMHNYV